MINLQDKFAKLGFEFLLSSIQPRLPFILVDFKNFISNRGGISKETLCYVWVEKHEQNLAKLMLACNIIDGCISADSSHAEIVKAFSVCVTKKRRIRLHDILTNLEMELITLMQSGVSARDASKCLGVSMKVIYSRRASIASKIGFKTPRDVDSVFASEQCAMQLIDCSVSSDQPQRGDDALVLQCAGDVAEFEGGLIRLRTREGMAIARAKGKLRGKQPKLSDKQQKELCRMHGSSEYTISDLAELFSVSRPTVYRTLSRWKLEP